MHCKRLAAGGAAETFFMYFRRRPADMFRRGEDKSINSAGRITKDAYPVSAPPVMQLN